MLSPTRGAAAATASCPLSTLHCISAEETAIGKPCEARYCASSFSNQLASLYSLITQAKLSDVYNTCTLQTYPHIAAVRRDLRMIIFSIQSHRYVSTPILLLYCNDRFGPKKVCIYQGVALHCMNTLPLGINDLLWLYQGCAITLPTLSCASSDLATNAMVHSTTLGRNKRTLQLADS